jgi:endonuclease/exonuclease/phosphatase family metal-dependent hydrolase
MKPKLPSFVLPLLLANLSLTNLSAQASTPPAAREPIALKVGTWNLEFLGADGNFRNNLPLRTDEDIAAIGKKVVELGVAVLAVQEINDEQALQKVAAGAGPSWACFVGTSGGWDDGKTGQRLGCLYDRAAVDLLAAGELLDLPRTFEGLPIFHRVPVTACFRHRASGCDFRIVTVHLKAGQKKEDEQKRRGEAQALAGWLDALVATAGEDGDVILLGDFNSSYGGEAERLFEQSGNRRYLEPSAPTPTIMHFADPIDQVVVDQRCAELVASSFRCDNDFDGMAKDAWRQRYSDHFPVVITLQSAGDDDPDARFREEPPAHRLPAKLRPPAPPTDDRSWPPRAGTKVTITTATDALHGVLLADLPVSGVGWVALKVDGERVVAVPIAQIHKLELR